MSRGGRTLAALALASSLVATCGVGDAHAADDPAVERGLAFLRSKARSQGVGEMALCCLALLKGEVPRTDPVVAACVTRLRGRFSSGTYTPERSGGPEIYEAAVVSMMLANLEKEAPAAELGVIAQFLLSRQNPNGSWDYVNRTKGDSSISQYAILGLWEAENAGVRIPPQTWERAAQFFLSTQGAAGSWNYHRDEPSHPETIAMTAAGIGSLLICQRQLMPYRRTADIPSSLLAPLTPEGPNAPHEVQITPARFDQAVRRGLGWIASNFVAARGNNMGSSPYYALYGLERIGALADRELLGRVSWLDQGRSLILGSQLPDGSWNAMFGVEMNTAWSILFLTKSTAKTLKRIEVKRLGAGTLLGGRGLPKDLSSMTIAGGKVVSRPMNGAVEGMLAVLEDPRAQVADSALAGLVTRFESEGPKVLRPHKDRFRKMLTDRDPGLRRVAAWALSRTGDLDVTPALIDALTDPEEEVVEATRLGLQLLSRKIEGLGPPSPSTPEQRRDAAARWRDWYRGIRPINLEGQEAEDSSGALAGPVSGSPR